MPEPTENQPLFGVSAVSPQALALRRALLQKQIEQGMDTSPIRSPWQGAARMVQSIMGNIQLGMSEREEAESRKKGEKETFELASKAGLNPYMAALLAHSSNAPFANQTIMEELAKKTFPVTQNTGLTLQPQSQLSGQPYGQPIPQQRVEQQSYGPSGVSGPTVVEPNRAPAVPPRTAPPVSMPNTAAPGVQVPAGFNAVNAGQSYSGVLTPEALIQKGLGLTDLYSRQKMQLEEKDSDFKRGMGAQQRRQVYQTLNDAYSAGGDAISGGPVGQKILEGKQLLNQVLGLNLEGLPETEVIKKTSGKLAQEAAAGLRGTNMEFNAALGRSPGLEMSNTGSKYMLHILNQENNRDERWAITGQKVAPEDYAQTRKNFYDSNPIVSPFTGKPLAGDIVEKDMQQLRSATGARTPQRPQTGGGWGRVWIEQPRQ